MKGEIMENMELYNAFRSVPDEALKPITAGRLKGFSDINPMWRIKVLTEKFGACGIGWYFEVKDKHLDAVKDEIVATVVIDMYVKVDGEWSKPIVGIGGSKLATMERSGVYVSDEAYKMALTDAISIACKNLGVAADVYYAKDRTKYTAPVGKANDEQDDISKANSSIVDNPKVIVLRKLMEEKGVPEQAVLDRYGVESVEKMTFEIWNKAYKALNASGGK